MFSKIFKFKKIVLGLISILVMLLSYPLFEIVLFATSKGLIPWKHDSSKAYKGILVSDFDDASKLKNELIRIANKNNINLFFKDYEIDNLNDNLVYYHISNQKYLDKLPLTEEISVNEFNNSRLYFTNNAKKNH